MKAHPEAHLPANLRIESVNSDMVAGGANMDAKGNSIATAAIPEESALMTLVKSWQRCGPTERRLFLADVHAGSPNLWRTVERDAGGRRR